MRRIDTTYWKVFYIEDLFDVVKGRRLKKSDHIEGNINYIGATIFNNGITAKIGNDSYLHPAGTITVCYNCSDIGTAFFQEEPFWATDDVNVLYPKFKITSNIAHFICPLVHRIGMTYTYENKWTAEKMRSSKIKLPSTPDGSPDWKYMEEYMRKIEQRTQTAISALVASQNKPCNIDTTYWKEFIIENIFSVSRPPARLATEFEKGDIPFVASGNENNGVEKYVVAKNEILDKKGCISVSPVDGSCFYQPYDFLGRGGAGSSIILLRNTRINQYNAFFVCSVLRKVCSKYNYSNMGSASKLKQEKILLPATPAGEPDWRYMEMYMRGVEAIAKEKISMLTKKKQEPAQQTSITNYGTVNIYEK